MFSKITLPLKSSREIFWPGSRRLGRLKPGTCSGWVNPEAGTSIRKHSSRIENRDDGDKGLCVPVSSLVDNSHSGYPPPLHSCRYMISPAARYCNWSNPKSLVSEHFGNDFASIREWDVLCESFRQNYLTIWSAGPTTERSGSTKDVSLAFSSVR